MIVRYECPVVGCPWKHDEDYGLAAKPGDLGRSAVDVERALDDHLDSHSAVELVSSASHHDSQLGRLLRQRGVTEGLEMWTQAMGDAAERADR